MDFASPGRIERRTFRVALRHVALAAELDLPESPRGVVLFAHGCGSPRRGPRGSPEAESLNEARLATLRVDLLTPEEAESDERAPRLRFEIALLAERLAGLADWLRAQAPVAGLPMGCFGVGTCAGAALAVAAQRPEALAAVVSRGGRPDLAGAALERVRAPTLLIVGGNDGPVIDMNEQALAMLRCEKRLSLVPGGTHLFDAPEALGVVATLARDWFRRHLDPRGAKP